MPIKMTRAEYNAKYRPEQPIQMTQAEYDAKYNTSKPLDITIDKQSNPIQELLGIQNRDTTSTEPTTLDRSAGQTVSRPSYLSQYDAYNINKDRYSEQLDIANRDGFGSYTNTDGEQVKVDPSGLQDTSLDVLFGGVGGAATGVAANRGIKGLIKQGKDRLYRKGVKGRSDINTAAMNRYNEESALVNPKYQRDLDSLMEQSRLRREALRNKTMSQEEYIKGDGPIRKQIDDLTNKANAIQDAGIQAGIDEALDPIILNVLPKSVSSKITPYYDPIFGLVSNKNAARVLVKEANAIAKEYGITSDEAIKIIKSRLDKVRSSKTGDIVGGSVGALLGGSTSYNERPIQKNIGLFD